MNERWAQIPVDLELTLGTVELSVAECAELTVGSRLHLPTPRGGGLPISANQEVLGSGRLVLTDDGRTLACEITHWTLVGEPDSRPES